MNNLTKETLIAVGQAIRFYRRQKKWSQEYLGFKSGLDRTYIGGAERGERNMTISSLVAISSALDVSYYDLIQKAKEYEKIDS